MVIHLHENTHHMFTTQNDSVALLTIYKYCVKMLDICEHQNDLFFRVPQLYLWGSPLLGEIFAYVTVF